MSIPIDFEKRVSQYVQVRDKIKELEAEHKAKLKPYKELLDNLGAVLLDQLNQTKQDSAKTGAGTVYRTSRKSASLADANSFMRFVIGGSHWDLLDRKANATAVADFIAENGSAPPGVNFTVSYEVGVRRK